MKTLLLLVVAAVVCSCESDSLTQSWATVGVPITQTVNKSVFVRDQLNLVAPFSVTIDSIFDSRCPSGVFCIWEGVGQVKFTIDGTDMLLAIGQSRPFRVNTTLFQITLTDITPHPSTTNSATQKEVIYLIIRIS